jgi:hypothetical protein
VKFKVPAAGEQRERGRGSAEPGAAFLRGKRTGIYYIINLCENTKNLGSGAKKTSSLNTIFIEKSTGTRRINASGS